MGTAGFQGENTFAFFHMDHDPAVFNTYFKAIGRPGPGQNRGQKYSVFFQPEASETINDGHVIIAHIGDMKAILGIIVFVVQI